MYRVRSGLVLMGMCCAVALFGQVGNNADCPEAIIICSDTAFHFTPDPLFDRDDFANPNNDPGCLETRERLSGWFYFEFRSDMPPDSYIEFTIDPDGDDPYEDYDFAIYGPDLTCDSLGSPLRCSYARADCPSCPQSGCTYCPLTGLGNNTTDVSEGPRDVDGYVAPMKVQPGEGFYLLIDHWFGTAGFVLSWGGSAAPYLRCISNADCAGVSINTGDSLTVCSASAPRQLQATVTGAEPGATYRWKGNPAVLAFLDRTDVLNPTLTAPIGFSGNFTLILEVNNGDCTKEKPLFVTVLPVTPINVTGPTQACAGTSVTLDAGPGFVSYRWSNNTTGQQATLPAGQTHSVTVTDSRGCVNVALVPVATFPQANFSISGPSSFCTNSNVTLTATNGFSNYQWSTGSNEPNITVSRSGPFWVSATDGNGCSYRDTVTVEALPLPTASIVGADQLCGGTATTLTVTGSFVTVLWSTGATSPSISIQTPGTYGVTVTGANGCQQAASKLVEGFPTPALDLPAQVQHCLGQSVTLQAPPGYRYRWSTGDSTATVQTAVDGTYGLTITDGNGCQASDVVNVNSFPQTPLAISGDSLFCPGDSALLVVTPGFSSYQWQDGPNVSNRYVTLEDTYRLTATDNNGCVQQATASVRELPRPEPELAGPSAICGGGELILSLRETYVDYRWSTGITDPILLATQAGNYGVTVTDQNGCSGSADFNIGAFPAIDLRLTGDSVICIGSVGSISGPGGFADYRWSDGSTDPQLTVTQGGTYSLTVTDDNGCQASASHPVREQATPSLSFDQEYRRCEGQSLTITAPPGMAGYRWSDGSTAPERSLTTSGNYTLTISDAFGCEAEAGFLLTMLTNPEPQILGPNGLCPDADAVLRTTLNWTAYQWSDSSTASNLFIEQAGRYGLTVTDQNGCQGSATKEIQAFPAVDVQLEGDSVICIGGNGRLLAPESYNRYSWSTGDTTFQILVTQAGNYQLTVTDNNGCSGSTDKRVREQAPPQLSFDTDYERCRGDSLVVSAPTGLASYEWSDGIMTPERRLTEDGSYGLTVTDAFGCQADAAFRLTIRPEPRPTIISPNGLCPDAEATLSTAETWTTYRWSDESTAAELRISDAGVYYVEVTDQVGCVGRDEVEVAALEPRRPDLGGPFAICPDGSKLLETDNPFNDYLWSDGSNQPTLAVSLAGNYSLTVTDENGCVSADTTVVTVHIPRSPEVPASLAFCPGESVSLELPTEFPAYQWSHGPNGPTVTFDQVGDYQVTVTDQNGCNSEAALTVTAHPVPTVTLDTPSPTCAGDTVWLQPNDVYERYSWSTGDTLSRIAVTRSGNYRLTVFNAQGCRAEAGVDAFFQEAAPLTLIGPDSFCPGDSVQLTVTTPVSNLEWSNGQTTATVTISRPGDYWVRSRDALGCLSEATKTLTTLATPDLIIEGDTAFCAGGSAQLRVSGDYQTVSWPDGSAGAGWSTQVGGDFQLRARHASGCEAVFDFGVEENQLPIAEAGPPDTLTCTINEIRLGVISGQTEQYQFDWSGPGLTSEERQQERPFARQRGWYSLVITDKNTGCASPADSVEIDEYRLAPSLELLPHDLLDCRRPRVTLELRPPMDQQVSWIWFSESTGDLNQDMAMSITVEQAGRYGIRAVNLRSNCEAVQTTEVLADFAAPTVDAGPGSELDCRANTQLMLNGDVSMANGAAYTLEWLRNSTGEVIGRGAADLPVSEAGWYTLRATNTQNGCSSADSVEIKDGRVLPTFLLESSGQLSCGVNSVQVSATGMGAGVDYRYNWWRDGRSLGQAGALTVGETGWYTVEVVNPLNNCSAVDSLLVERLDDGPVPDLMVISPVCAGDRDGVIQVVETQGANQPFRYRLDNGGPTPEAFFDNLAPGQYRLSVEDAAGCSFDTLVIVQEGARIELELGEDRKVNYNESVHLIPEHWFSDQPVTLLEWTANDGRACPSCHQWQLDSLKNKTEVTLELMDINGCTVSDRMTIHVVKPRRVFVPNVFSPNGDGDNDKFKIYTSEDVVSINSMHIYDRWGGIMYAMTSSVSPQDTDYGWDGRFKDRPANPGVYVYVIEIEYDDGETDIIAGDVTLMR